MAKAAKILHPNNAKIAGKPWLSRHSALFSTHYSDPFAVIEPGEAALAGLPESVIQVDAGFPHGAAYHVVADVSGAGEEIAQIAGIHGPDGGNGVVIS